jgi:hypothetical protein
MVCHPAVSNAERALMRGLYQVSLNTPFGNAIRSLSGPASEYTLRGAISRAHSETDLVRRTIRT